MNNVMIASGKSTLQSVTTILTILGLCLLASVRAEGCTCSGARQARNFQPCEIFWRYDIVFVGLVEKLSYEKSSDGRYYNRMTAHLRVEQPIRGVNMPTVEVETSPSSASCGFPFKDGERYMVYLKREPGRKFREHLCGPTVRLSAAAADVEYIKQVKADLAGGRVFGNILRHVQNQPTEQSAWVGLPGITVRLQGYDEVETDGRRKAISRRELFQTITDADGFYNFVDIPAGKYSIGVAWPDKVTELSGRGRLNSHSVFVDGSERRCARADFVGTSTAIVEGRVHTRGDAKIAQQYIHLLPIGQDGKPRLDWLYKYAWISPKDGSYRFDTVAPGSYVIAVNPNDCPRKDASQNGPTFYPDVSNSPEAKLITVGDAEVVKVKDFELMPERRPRAFSGTVYQPDGKIAVNARVALWPSREGRCSDQQTLVETRTDMAGRFQLDAYEGYDYRLLTSQEPSNGTRTLFVWHDIPASKDSLSDIRLTLKIP